jgi:hypothetical protein
LVELFSTTNHLSAANRKNIYRERFLEMGCYTFVQISLKSRWVEFQSFITVFDHMLVKLQLTIAPCSVTAFFSQIP